MQVSIINLRALSSVCQQRQYCFICCFRLGRLPGQPLGDQSVDLLLAAAQPTPGPAARKTAEENAKADGGPSRRRL
jgi:hypothetical protein